MVHWRSVSGLLFPLRLRLLVVGAGAGGAVAAAAAATAVLLLLLLLLCVEVLCCCGGDCSGSTGSGSNRVGICLISSITSFMTTNMHVHIPGTYYRSLHSTSRQSHCSLFFHLLLVHNSVSLFSFSTLPG